MARRRKFRSGPSSPSIRSRPRASRPMMPPTEIPAGAGTITPETELELEALDVPEGPLVGVVMGSEGDAVVMQGALDELSERGISFESTVVSAHRDPDQVRGIKVIIAGAGMAAALPGAVAAHTDLPVIGVPIRSEDSVSGGLDALLSIAQSPSGVPVACVAINGSRNAAILAARILFA